MIVPPDIRPALEALEKHADRLRAATIHRLGRIGEMAVKEARLRGNYIDHTRNLRSSIGFVIVENGNIIQASSFAPISGIDEHGKPQTGTEGSQKGRAYAEELAAQHPKGLVLIMVAGMHYAVYVAKKCGRDVLDSGILTAEKEAQKLAELINKHS